MLTSPGWRDRTRQAVALGVFTLGLAAGGMLSALVLWLLSGLAAPVPAGVRSVVIIAVAGLGVLRDLGMLRLPLPQNARQVPQEVLRRGTVRGSLRFGFELGTGVRTYVSATAPYVLAVALLLSAPSLGVAVLAGLGFGLGRAATPLTQHASGDPAGWNARLLGRLPVIVVGGGVAILIGLLLRI